MMILMGQKHFSRPSPKLPDIIRLPSSRYISGQGHTFLRSKAPQDCECLTFPLLCIHLLIPKEGVMQHETFEWPLLWRVSSPSLKPQFQVQGYPAASVKLSDFLALASPHSLRTGRLTD